MKNAGFGLVDLLTTITISGVLMGSAVPSLFSTYERSKSTGHISSVINTLKAARNYAITHNKDVFICGSNTQHSCSKTWNKFIIAFVDSDNNKTLSGDDKIIFLHQFTDSNSYFYSRIASGMQHTQFNTLGAAKYAGSFIYCPKNQNKRFAHRATWNRLGRSYRGRDKNGDGFIDDTSKNKINCY